MEKSKFDLYDTGEVVGKIKKEKPKKEPDYSLRFVIQQHFLWFSTDLWNKVFDGCQSIRMMKVDKDHDDNPVDLLYIKGYKTEVTEKNIKMGHRVNVVKATDRRYLNLNYDTFEKLNPRLNKKQGGAISRLYKVPNENISEGDNMVIVEFNFSKNWSSNSSERPNSKKTDDKLTSNDQQTEENKDINE